MHFLVSKQEIYGKEKKRKGEEEEGEEEEEGKANPRYGFLYT